MKKFPVALQLFSVRHEISKNLYGTLKQVKKMGYDGVEFAGLAGHSTEEVAEICADLGLIPISAHVPYLEMLADPEKVIGSYAALGCKYIAVPYLTEEYRPGTEKFPEVVQNIKKLGEVAKKCGLILVYHNHDFEFITLNGKYALDIIYEEVPADLLETELDVCWVNVGGEDPKKYIMKYAGRDHILHLKDFVGEKSENMYELIGIEKKAPTRPANFEFRPVGYGKQDFPGILDCAEKTGVEWIVVEQDNPSMGKTPLECAEASLKYLQSIGRCN